METSQHCQPIHSILTQENWKSVPKKKSTTSLFTAFFPFFLCDSNASLDDRRTENQNINCLIFEKHNISSITFSHQSLLIILKHHQQTTCIRNSHFVFYLFFLQVVGAGEVDCGGVLGADITRRDNLTKQFELIFDFWFRFTTARARFHSLFRTDSRNKSYSFSFSGIFFFKKNIHDFRCWRSLWQWRNCRLK